MDRLVAVEITELHLRLRLSPEPSTAAFTVTSLLHTMPVAVHLATTRPALYSFAPSAVALLPPLSSAVFTLVLQPTPSPPLASPPDSLLVRSAVAPALRRSDPPSLRGFFSRPTVPIFRDATLPIHLTGPNLLRSILISGQAASGGGGGFRSSVNDALLSRVIASCSQEELSAILPVAAACGAGVSALLAAGSDPNARGAGGKTALSIAVSAGKAEAAKALIEAGADDRPFHEAAAANRPDLILLLTGAGSAHMWADIADYDGRTPVHAAAASGAINALRLCFSSGGGDPDRSDASGWTPLHCAAAGGHLEAAKLIIDSSGFDPRLALTREGKGKKRRTPLDVAAEMGYAHLYGILRPGGEVGAKARDQNGWTALHVAAFKGRLEAVMGLVEGGAELDAVDGGGYTPLRCAVEAGRAEVALWLVGCGAVVGLKGLLSLGGAAAAALRDCGSFVRRRFPLLFVGGRRAAVINDSKVILCFDHHTFPCFYDKREGFW
ncbi:Potassium channel AKT6 [Apostasia shenzhenica]|uniref:Potassium channel AKT6 n=1 Tax=Apostasia shenzhenica TaxID=1088818 RepID=A0A2I0AZC7_9ASPA|nr:Potassium channel AKT6 [Apostasia shenzhenica]